MIQILGLRPYFNEKKQAWDITDSTFFKKNWRAPSVSELLKNLSFYLEKIPEKERFNLFYTVANCGDGKREFRKQHVMMFDIDGLRFTANASAPGGFQECALYIETTCRALGISPKETGIVFSGNGLHFIIELQTPILEPQFFDINRRHYAALCARIDFALAKAGLPGKADPAVFDARRIMRLPGTLNKKEGKPERLAALLESNVVAIPFDITQLSGLPSVEAADHINPQTLRRYPRPDTTAVLQGCDFLKFCKDSPNEVSEEQWYASLSILPRLENGHDLAHEYSRGHHSYSPTETDAKIEQALAASGPRTCVNINKTWGKCAGCPHFEKVTSPIMIRGENYIKTLDTGFHDIKLDAKGNPIPGAPNYEDLRRYFESKHPYVVLSDTCYVWNGKFYEEMEHRFIEAFAQEHFNPPAKGNMRQEFLGRVLCSNLKRGTWFEETTRKRMNFQNGVFDLESKELLPHSPDRGFRHVLPYAFDASAKAPRFERFLGEITGGDPNLPKILLEFAGYAFSNDSCWTAKCLMMTGEGRNGKSTFINVLKALAGGDEHVASLTLTDIKSEVARSQLDGRMFNIAEETPVYATIENTAFKNLVTGGTTLVKKLYHQPYTIRNRCKFIFACNELPRAKDTTRAYLRRFLIVPFNQVFEGSNDDKQLEAKLLAELPGVFNLVLEGYERLKKAQEFTGSKAVEKALETYKLEIDTVAAWARDCVETKPLPCKDFVAAEKLYTSYRFFTQNRGMEPVEYIPFTRSLERAIDNYDGRQTRRVIDGKKCSVIHGISYGEASDF